MALGVGVLASVPFLITTPSWKRALAAVLAGLLAIFWVLLVLAIREPRYRTTNVGIILGVIGGVVVAEFGVGLYCVASDCAAGFDALFLVPAGALFGAVVGGVIGSTAGARMERGRPPHPDQQQEERRARSAR
jgi:hypothetical protein